MKRLIWTAFIILLIEQWAVPSQMIWKKHTIQTKGKLFKFQTAPVDPSDPFIGKYIVLNFKENSLKMRHHADILRGSKVFVTFLEVDGFARIKNITNSKPPTTTYMEAVVRSYSSDADSDIVYIDYPVDRFYMQEYKAPQAEMIYNERTNDSLNKTYALINVYKGGAVIKDVLINDTSISDIIKSNQIVR